MGTGAVKIAEKLSKMEELQVGKYFAIAAKKLIVVGGGLLYA